MIGGKNKVEGRSEKLEGGFTIIELATAVTIFAIAVSAAISIFLAANRGQRRVAGIASTYDNARYGLESMAKEMRMGTEFVLTDGGTEVSFKNYDGKAIIYKLAVNSLQRSEEGGIFVPITSDNVKITMLKFFEDGVAESDKIQPRITITMHIEGVGSQVEEQAKFDLQTTISQRNLDS